MDQALIPSSPVHNPAEAKRHQSPQRDRLLEAMCDTIAKAISAKGLSCEEIQAALGDRSDTRVPGDIGRIKERKPDAELGFDRLLRLYDAVRRTEHKDRDENRAKTLTMGHRR